MTTNSTQLAIAITDKVNAMMAYWDKDQICRFANAAYLTWFGKTSDEMVGKMTLRELLGPIYEKNLPYIINALQGEVQTFEREISTPNGLRHSLATYFPNVVNGHVEGFFVHVADVTSLKVMEKELISRNSVIEKQNNKLINYTRILSNQTSELKHINEELNASNDSLVLVNQQLSEAHDVIAKRTSELEQALTKANELAEMKGRLVSMVSHEFRSPLSVIKFSTHLLRSYRDKMTPDQIEEKFDKVDRQLSLLGELLEDVLDFGLFESGNKLLCPESMSVSCVREYAEEVMLLHSTHQLNYYQQDDLIQFRTDERLIRHIVSNLVANAIKYSPDANEVKVAVTSDQTGIVISVEDYGMGIPPDEIKELFSVFHRAGNVGNIKGTGLGLSIVKRCTDLLQAKIIVNSELGKGSEFKVVLPLLA